eukprot:scaffold278062_cov14-Tisochrysis_lutea.AAC.2
MRWPVTTGALAVKCQMMTLSLQKPLQPQAATAKAILSELQVKVFQVTKPYLGANAHRTGT